MKTFKKTIFGILIVSLACAILSGCSGLSKVKDIKVTSCGLESYSLKGLRSIDAVLAVGIDNPTFAFKVMDVSGTVKYNGEDTRRTRSAWTRNARRSMTCLARRP